MTLVKDFFYLLVLPIRLLFINNPKRLQRWIMFVKDSGKKGMLTEIYKFMIYLRIDSLLNDNYIKFNKYQQMYGRYYISFYIFVFLIAYTLIRIL